MSNQIKIQLPDMYPKQKRAAFTKARYSYIEGSTKSGKTVGMIVWQLVMTQEKVGVHWWISPTYQVSKIAYRRVKEMIHQVPALVQSFSDSALEIRFTNGSYWNFKSADNADALYGEETESVVIDEASRVSEAVFIAANSTLTTTMGPMRIIGNVQGKGNWFYKGCRNAENGQPNTSYTKLVAQDAVDAGIMDAQTLIDARSMLSDAVYKELYECIPMDSASNPFGVANIERIATLPKGQLAKGPAVCYGLDVAHVKDWSVLTGLNKHGEVCVFQRFQLEPREALKLIREHTTPQAPICIDRTGVGYTYASDLAIDRRVIPYNFTYATKVQLMDGLNMAINQELIGIPYDSIIYRELMDMEHSYRQTAGNTILTYGAPSGQHDDTVDSLALAYHAGNLKKLFSSNVDRLHRLMKQDVELYHINLSPIGGTRYRKY